MVRERGSGVTPQRVVELLKNAVAEKSMLAVSNTTGLGLAAIGRYLKGIGEPTTATLQKLAAYFGVSVAWLRGGSIGELERFLEGLKGTGIDPITYNKTVAGKIGKEGDYWSELVGGNALLNSDDPVVLCGFFPGINQYWVQTGLHPTLLNAGGYVGTLTANQPQVTLTSRDGGDLYLFEEDETADYGRFNRKDPRAGGDSIVIEGTLKDDICDAYEKIVDLYKGKNIRFSEFIASCLRLDDELKKDVERLLAADSPNNQQIEPRD